MRIWDVSARELDDRALLAEHRELHGLFNVLTLGRKGYATHPETLRWKGRLRALAERHDLEVEEFRRRGWPSGLRHATPIDRARIGRKESAEFPAPLQPLAQQRRLLRRKAQTRRPPGVRYALLPGKPGFERAIALRTEVFVREQQVPEEIEHDEHDDTAVHALATVSGTVVATGRLVVEGGTARIGRMAVARERRGSGLGRAILQLLLAEARRMGLPAARLHAQTHARNFYAREGFRECSEVFQEAGIDHVEMEKRLRPQRSERGRISVRT
ncbi:MAG: GNAT family N-acetyltransferase [Candidatus Wallbacteria bacterium]|nr:GNAT family N-acetyltransferase [Candidatus Wallbacteria bacterium]